MMSNYKLLQNGTWSSAQSYHTSPNCHITESPGDVTVASIDTRKTEWSENKHWCVGEVVWHFKDFIWKLPPNSRKTICFALLLG